VSGGRYRVVFDAEAEADVDSLPAHHKPRVRDAVARQLLHQPAGPGPEG
jgi:hypothetical protein